jgi:hypothetical protein
MCVGRAQKSCLEIALTHLQHFKEGNNFLGSTVTEDEITSLFKQNKLKCKEDIQPLQELKYSVCQCAGKVRYLYSGIQVSSTLASSTPSLAQQLLLLL